jgi:hypothetical protein
MTTGEAEQAGPRGGYPEEVVEWADETSTRSDGRTLHDHHHTHTDHGEQLVPEDVDEDLTDLLFGARPDPEH